MIFFEAEAKCSKMKRLPSGLCPSEIRNSNTGPRRKSKSDRSRPPRTPPATSIQ